MGFANSKIEAVLLILVAIGINLLFFYGLITRPIIAYNLSTPLDYNGEVDFSTGDLPVNLEVTNEGKSPSRVEMVVRTYNMSLTGPEGVEASVEGTYSELHIPIGKPIRQSRNESSTVTLNTDENATYLVLILSIEPPPRHTPVLAFYDSFTIYKPVRPTALLLKHTDGNKYMRVKNR